MEVSSVGSISLNLSSFIPKSFWRENCPSCPFKPAYWLLQWNEDVNQRKWKGVWGSEVLLAFSLKHFCSPLCSYMTSVWPCQSCIRRKRTLSWDHQTWFQMTGRTCCPSLCGAFLSIGQGIKSLGCSLLFEAGSQQKCNSTPLQS